MNDELRKSLAEVEIIAKGAKAGHPFYGNQWKNEKGELTVPVKVTQRRYPDRKWDYKAVSVKPYKDTELFYHTGSDKDKPFEGVEVYSGKNYVMGSEAPSRSYRYDMDKIPAKYKEIVDALKEHHKKTEWSNKERVDNN